MRNVVVIAGPAGSGKDSLIRGIIERYPKTAFGITATTRAPRPGEQDGVNYFFLSKQAFLDGIEKGDIPEHYHRPETDTYYGLYKPYLDRKVAEGSVVLYQIQIVGARYLKQQYSATTFFIMPPSIEVLERRVRSRAPLSDIEWKERLEFTQREIKEEAPWYDHHITNEDGKLADSIAAVVEILKKEGYTLE